MAPIDAGTDDDFLKLSLPTYGPTAGTPEPANDFRGLVIRAPKRVRLSRSKPFPLCGAIRLPNSALEKLPEPPIEAIVVTFVNRATHRPVSFNLLPDKPRAPPDETLPPDVVDLDLTPLPPGVVVVKDPVFTQYFNIDVLMFSPEFPRTPAVYNVFALLGSFKSNVIQVEVAKE